jgi:phosphoribosylpyrophosphate synthetase
MFNILLAAGATSVSCFVAHGVFPNDCWKKFSKNEKYGECFNHFWLTNSIPTVTSKLPTDDVFEVLDLLPQVVEDLDSYCN